MYTYIHKEKKSNDNKLKQNKGKASAFNSVFLPEGLSLNSAMNSALPFPVQIQSDNLSIYLHIKYHCF